MKNFKFYPIVIFLFAIQFKSLAQSSIEKDLKSLTYRVSNVTDVKMSIDLKETLLRNFGEKIIGIELGSDLSLFKINFGEYYNAQEILEFFRDIQHEASYTVDGKMYKLEVNGNGIQTTHVSEKK